MNMEIIHVNIYCQLLGDMDISHSNETSIATTNKHKAFTLLKWKWKTCITQHARMQNQIQIENQRQKQRHTVNT